MEKSWRAMLLVLSCVPFFSLSGLKSWIYRRAGASVGEHVHFAPYSRIVLPDFHNLKIGDGTVFGRSVKIYCESLEVGQDTHFSAGVFADGPASLKVGDGCYFFRGVYIDLNEPVIIEDDVGIGADYIFTHSIWHPVTEGGPRKFAGVHIKRGAWIPAGVFIMPGVTIGEGATVGARAVVVEDVPDGVLVVGIPAKIVKTAEEARRKLSFEDKSEIVKQILDEYTSSTAKATTRALSEMPLANLFSKGYLIETTRKRLFWVHKNRTAVVYSVTTIGEARIACLEDLCRKFDTVLLVSLIAIPEGLTKKLEEKQFSNLFWFNVEEKIRKRSWKQEAVSLHEFFWSRYGIRFRFQGGKARES